MGTQATHQHLFNVTDPNMWDKMLPVFGLTPNDDKSELSPYEVVLGKVINGHMKELVGIMSGGTISSDKEKKAHDHLNAMNTIAAIVSKHIDGNIGFECAPYQFATGQAPTSDAGNYTEKTSVGQTQGNVVDDSQVMQEIETGLSDEGVMVNQDDWTRDDESFGDDEASEHQVIRRQMQQMTLALRPSKRPRAG